MPRPVRFARYPTPALDWVLAFWPDTREIWMKILLAIFLFLAAVGAFASLSPYAHRGAVEGELARLSREALAEEGFDGVEVSVDHSTVTLTVPGGLEDTDRLAEILRDRVPGARFPEEGGVEIAVLPTRPPLVRMSRERGDGPVRIGGSLAEGEASVRDFLVERLTEAGAGEVINEIRLAADRLPFARDAELASLGAELCRLSRPFSVELDEGKLAVSGKVSDAGTKSALLRVAESVGAEKIDDGLEVVAAAEPDRPATLRITRTKEGYAVEGRLPDEKTAQRLAFSVARKNPSLRFDDGIDVSDRVMPPEWFGEAKELMVLFLQGVEEGAVAEFSSGRAFVSATVTDGAAKESIETLLARLEEKASADEEGDGDGFETVAKLRMAVDPVPAGQPPLRRPLVRARLGGGVLTLSGEVPDAGAEVLAEAVREEFPDIEVRNELRAVSAVRGEEWLERVPSFLVELCSRASSADVTMGRGRVELEGEAPGSADPQILRNLAVNTVPSGFAVENRMVHVPPQVDLTGEQRGTLVSLLAEQAVYFASGSDSVNAEGEEKLEKIHAAIAETGADVELVAGGFSDNRGNPETNRALSIQRAEAVRDALVGLGFPEERIEAVSFGVDEVNTLASQRWKARRVEVRLREEGGEAEEE